MEIQLYTDSDYFNSVFIDTSLGTHLITLVSCSDTVSDLKKNVLRDHVMCFPHLGDIKIHGVKVKRREEYYYLPESMLVKSAFHGVTEGWFISVDASSLEEHNGNMNRNILNPCYSNEKKNEIQKASKKKRTKRRFKCGIFDKPGSLLSQGRVGKHKARKRKRVDGFASKEDNAEVPESGRNRSQKETEARDRFLGNPDRVVSYNDDAIGGPSTNSFIEANKEGGTIVQRSTVQSERTRVLKKHSDFNNAKPTENSVDELLDQSLEDSPKSKPPAKRRKISQAENRDEDLLKDHGALVSDSNKLMLARSTISEKSPVDKQHTRNATLDGSSIGAPEPVHLQSVSPSNETGKGVKKSAKTYNQATAVVDDNGMRNREAGNVEGGQNDGAEEHQNHVSGHNDRAEERELSPEISPKTAYSDKHKISAQDDLQSKAKETTVGSELLEASESMDPPQLFKKKKKSKKKEDLASGTTPSTSAIEHVKDFISSISSTKPQKIANGDHLNETCSKEEGDRLPEVGKEADTMSTFLATDKEVNDVIQNVVKSIQQMGKDEVSTETMHGKTRKGSSKKQNSDAELLPESSKQNENIGKNVAGDMLYSSKMEKHATSANTGSTNHLNGSLFEWGKDTTVENDQGIQSAEVLAQKKESHSKNRCPEAVISSHANEVTDNVEVSCQKKGVNFNDYSTSKKQDLEIVGPSEMLVDEATATDGANGMVKAKKRKKKKKHVAQSDGPSSDLRTLLMSGAKPYTGNSSPVEVQVSFIEASSEKTTLQPNKEPSEVSDRGETPQVSSKFHKVNSVLEETPQSNDVKFTGRITRSKSKMAELNMEKSENTCLLTTRVNHEHHSPEDHGHKVGRKACMIKKMQMDARESVLGNADRVVSYNDDDIFGSSRNSFPEANKEGGTIVKRSTAQSERTRVQEKHSELNNAKSTEDNVDELLDQSLIDSPKSKPAAKRQKNSQGKSRDEDLLKDEGALVSESNKLVLALSGISQKSPFDKQHARNATLHGSSIGAPEPVHLQSVSPNHERRKGGKKSAKLNNQETAVVDENGMRNREAGNVEGGQDDGAEERQYNVSGHNDRVEERELSPEIFPKSAYSEKHSLSAQDDLQSKAKETTVGSKLLEASETMDPPQLSKKKKKSIKTKDLASVTPPSTSVLEHVKDFTSSIPPTKPQKIANGDHLSETCSKEEGEKLPEVGKEAETMSTSFLATGKEVNDVIKNVVESIQQMGKDEVSTETMHGKTRKRSSKKQSSDANLLSDSSKENENIGKNNAGDILYSSEMEKQDTLANTGLTNHLTGSLLECGKDTTAENDHGIQSAEVLTQKLESNSKKRCTEAVISGSPFRSGRPNEVTDNVEGFCQNNGINFNDYFAPKKQDLETVGCSEMIVDEATTTDGANGMLKTKKRKKKKKKHDAHSDGPSDLQTPLMSGAKPHTGNSSPVEVQVPFTDASAEKTTLQPNKEPSEVSDRGAKPPMFSQSHKVNSVLEETPQSNDVKPTGTHNGSKSTKAESNLESSKVGRKASAIENREVVNSSDKERSLVEKQHTRNAYLDGSSTGGPEPVHLQLVSQSNEKRKGGKKSAKTLNQETVVDDNGTRNREAGNLEGGQNDEAEEHQNHVSGHNDRAEERELSPEISPKTAYSEKQKISAQDDLQSRAKETTMGSELLESSETMDPPKLSKKKKKSKKAKDLATVTKPSTSAIEHVKDFTSSIPPTKPQKIANGDHLNETCRKEEGDRLPEVGKERDTTSTSFLATGEKVNDVIQNVVESIQQMGKDEATTTDGANGMVKAKKRKKKKHDAHSDGPPSDLKTSQVSGAKPRTGNSSPVEVQVPFTEARSEKTTLQPNKEPPQVSDRGEKPPASSKFHKVNSALETPQSNDVKPTGTVNAESNLVSSKNIRLLGTRVNREHQSPEDHGHKVGKKASAIKNGEVVNGSKKERSLVGGSIFNDDSDEVSFNEDDSSDASTITPSDASLSSDYSDGESNADYGASANGSRSWKGEEGGRKPKTPIASGMTLENILRSSSTFKKVKLTASQLQLEDPESLIFNFGPTQDADLKFRR